MNEQCLAIVFFVLRVGKNGTISYLCRGLLYYYDDNCFFIYNSLANNILHFASNIFLL